jgi:hypothetical protein
LENLEIELALKRFLYSQVLFLDGMTRAGKFLLGKICSNFNRIEHFQVVQSLEHISILEKFRLIKRSNGRTMMQIILDSAIYNMAIGRNLNLRATDGSSVTNSLDFEDYLKRGELDDGNAAIIQLSKKNRLPSFVVHECLAHIEFFFETFPYLQMVHIQRHPIDLIHSWLVRGWGERFGQDPLSFSPTFQGKEHPYPWFAKDWQDEYEGMSAVDRVIKSIYTLFRLSYGSFDKLDEKQKSKILMLSYEEFFSDPASVVKQLSKHLDTEPHKNMEKVLVREGCYNQISIQSRKNKYKELSGQASPKVLDLLEDISLEYEALWSLEASF